MIFPACSTIKRRPVPSGDSDIQSGRSSLSAGNAGCNATSGKGWAKPEAAASDTAKTIAFTPASVCLLMAANSNTREAIAQSEIGVHVWMRLDALGAPSLSVLVTPRERAGEQRRDAAATLRPGSPAKWQSRPGSVPSMFLAYACEVAILVPHCPVVEFFFWKQKKRKKKAVAEVADADASGGGESLLFDVFDVSGSSCESADRHRHPADADGHHHHADGHHHGAGDPGSPSGDAHSGSSHSCSSHSCSSHSCGGHSCGGGH